MNYEDIEEDLFKEFGFPITSKNELNEETFSQILDYLGITIKFNIITKKIEITGMPDKFAKSDLINVLPIYLKDILKINGINVTTKVIEEFIVLELSKNNFNPVRELLKANSWDKKDRINEIYSILHIEDDLYKILVKKWLYQTVAILFNSLENPFGAEGVLTLQGKQGIGKSRFFSLISIKPEWFADGISIDMNNKDSIIKSTSYWIAELGELDSTVKKEQSVLKAFITSPIDDIRPPYGKSSIRRPRVTSFCATVNPEEFLKDSTGNRRFWVIPANKIDYQRLESYGKEWIIQLWTQIYEEVKIYWKNTGTFKIFRLSTEEREKLEKYNIRYTEFLPYEEEILQKFNFNGEKYKWTCQELIDKYFEKGNSSMIGKAIRKIKNNYPELVEIKRNNAGNIYYLPIKK